MEDDEGSEVPVEEGMHFVGAGDDSDEFDISADFVDPSLIDYLASHVSEGSTLNMLSHIVRTICDRKGSMSNESVISCFERERDAFGARDLPICWGYVLKKLDVPELSSSCRHMCKNGHHVWRHLPNKMFKLHENDKCPICEHPRFQKVRGMLKHVRVLFYAGLGSCISDLFLEPAWAASWKKNLDGSINGVHQSEHAKLMNEYFNGEVLQKNSGLYSLFDDGFTTCSNGTNGITLLGLMSHDVGPEMLSREINRRTVMLISPPEPSNTTLLLDELIEDINMLAKDGIKVTHDGRNFTHKAFLFSWMADAIGRMKLLGIGGPAKYVSCSNCWQPSTYLCNGTWYPGGYAKPIRVWVTEGGGHYIDMYAGNYSPFEINQWCS